jgi:hypothetical protein
MRCRTKMRSNKTFFSTSKAIDAPKHGTDSKLKSQIKSFKPDMAQRPDWMGGPRASTSVSRSLLD